RHSTDAAASRAVPRGAADRRADAARAAARPCLDRAGRTDRGRPAPICADLRPRGGPAPGRAVSAVLGLFGDRTRLDDLQVASVLRAMGKRGAERIAIWR